MRSNKQIEDDMIFHLKKNKNSFLSTGDLMKAIKMQYTEENHFRLTNILKKMMDNKLVKKRPEMFHTVWAFGKTKKTKYKDDGWNKLKCLSCNTRQSASTKSIIRVRRCEKCGSSDLFLEGF